MPRRRRSSRRKYRMLLTFDHMGPLKAGARVRDMSRHRNGGVVMVQAPGRVTKSKGVHGSAANLPNRGRAIIEVKDRAGLDPGSRLFTFGAAVRMTRSQAVSGSNVMQKGYFKTRWWSVQAADRARRRTRLVSSSAHGPGQGRPRRRASPTTNGTGLHASRGKTGVTVRVDGKLRGLRRWSASGRSATQRRSGSARRRSTPRTSSSAASSTTSTCGSCLNQVVESPRNPCAMAPDWRLR